MENYIFLTSRTDDFRVAVAPLHGGMVSQVYLQGKPMLCTDTQVLELSPMAAGGMPLLFPFASKTAGDQYELDGQSYGMPMHGLLKNASFAVKEVTEDRATLWMEPSPAWVSACYPFAYHLEVTYQVSGRSLCAAVSITNRSSKPMPHYMGWHPFFLATDKTQLSFKHPMTVHYDYVRHEDQPMSEALDLSQRLDDVYHTPNALQFRLENPVDNYSVDCQFDNHFQVMVVCSWVKDSMCIEPWCGIPDGIHQKRFLQWIAPQCTESYQISLTWNTMR